MRRRILMIMLSLITVLAMSAPAFANSYEADGGSYTFNGSVIVTNTGSTLVDTISGLQPGDDVTIELTYTNKDKGTTEWYMKNDVLKTLEETGSAAKNGGYTYILQNVGPSGTVTTLFSNDKVGGESSEGGEGLHQATNATKDDWFFIQELGPGQSGKTRLYVALEGEAEVNTYAKTSAELNVQYAVEKADTGKTIYKTKNSARTGDDTNMLIPILLMLAAGLLLLLALLSLLKDRKRGEDA